VYESLPAIDVLIDFMNANGGDAYCDPLCSNTLVEHCAFHHHKV